jgi:hypothetical protein
MIMKNYAVIENDIVINIVVADEEWANAQTATLVEYTEENSAWMGGDYVGGFFYPPKPFASWTRNNGSWVAPVEKPTDITEGDGSATGDFAYIWNEPSLSWNRIEIPDGRFRQTKYIPIGDEFID